MQCEPARYAQYVEGFDLSADRKAELIRLVWTMMQSFVDRAFGDAPEQIAVGNARERITACGPDALGSKLTLTPTYNAAASVKAPRKKKP